MPAVPTGAGFQFQSSPPSGRGCAGSVVVCRLRLHVVSILTPFGKGMRHLPILTIKAIHKVSILTPFGKGMRRRSRPGTGSLRPGFNPHPLREGDAPLCGQDIGDDQIWFQSSPPSGRGCAGSNPLPPVSRGWFQSSPPSGRGCATLTGVLTGSDIVFQSSPPSGRGCAHGTSADRNVNRVVSILTPFGKGMRRSSTRRPAGRRYCFNPHPLREGDAPSWAPCPREW